MEYLHLKLINLTIGISSYNIKVHVPSNVGIDQFYIPAKNLKTQEYLYAINQWTESQMMKINEKKTKSMVFNFTKNYQFMTDLELNKTEIDVETETKLLGTILSNQLSWDSNTKNIVKRANARMQILHKIASFGASINDLKDIYFSYIRSILEQSSNVWHTSLTKENEESLERVQKSALKIILKDNYLNYENACDQLGLTDLKTRRAYLFEKFTLQSLNHPHMKEYFTLNNKNDYSLRNIERFKITQSRCERLKNSAIIQMQYTANKLHKDGKIK